MRDNRPMNATIRIINRFEVTFTLRERMAYEKFDRNS